MSANEADRSKRTVGLQAGSLVTPAQLIGFAQTITEVPPASVGNRPSVDLVSDPLPADLTVLVGEDVPFDEQGIFDRQSPIEAERVVVRGHDGYRYVSEATDNGVPIEVDIWWSEAPGVVVSVWSSSLYTAHQLTALIEQLEPADVAGYQAFARS